jgi:hypothetical protein
MTVRGRGEGATRKVTTRDEFAFIIRRSAPHLKANSILL